MKFKLLVFMMLILSGSGFAEDFPEYLIQTVNASPSFNGDVNLQQFLR